MTPRTPLSASPEPHGIDDWLDALTRLGLQGKRRGAEYQGPCPLCGGDDRFHVAPKNRNSAGVRTYCRHCAAQPGHDADTWFRRVVERLFGAARYPGWPPPLPHPRAHRTRSTPAPASSRSATPAKRPQCTPADLPALLASLAVPVTDTPAARYLEARRVIPPAAALTLVPAGLLDNTAWLAAASAPRPSRAGGPPGWPGLPADAAGAFLCRLHTPGGALQAVSLEALDANGSRLERRWRRTFGTRHGTAFRTPAAPPQDDPEPPLVMLCEGELDALALAADGRADVALALGGTAGFASLDACDNLLASGARVVVVTDADDKGRLAALDFRLAAAACTPPPEVSVYEPPQDGGDPQAWLFDRIETELAALPGTGETLAAAWTRYVERARTSAPLLDPARYAHSAAAPPLDRLLRDLLRLLRAADRASDAGVASRVLQALRDHAASRPVDAQASGPQAETAGFLDHLRSLENAPGLAERVGHAFDAARESLPRPLTGRGWLEEPPPRTWLLHGWLPQGEITLLTGPGENGKSLLTLQIGLALACDRSALPTLTAWLPPNDANPPLGLPADDAPAVPRLADDPVTVCICGWEDDRAEFQRRRRRMAYALPWTTHPSINERCEVRPFRGHGPLWGGSGDPRGLTRAGRELLKACERAGAALLVLDPASLALALEENDRAAVSRALDYFAGWAYETRCAVLVTGHPAKAATGPGRDYSGSTAWRGLTRALWTLRPPRAFESGSARTKERVKAWRQDLRQRRERAAELSLNKANYAYADPTPLLLETTGGGACWTRRPSSPADDD